MVATATRTILENLERIPNEDQRTKVAVIAFDVSIYFFSMPVRIRRCGTLYMTNIQCHIGGIHRVDDARSI
jgi:protein transport protein SEC24